MTPRRRWPACPPAARRWRRVVAAAAIAGAAACSGGTTTPTAPSPTVLRADVSDASGDTLSDARVAVAPDLVRAVASVENSSLTLTISFAPGTFDRQTTHVSVLCDTDENTFTGIRQPNGLGADYSVDLLATNAQTIVARADEVGCAARQSCFVNSGSGTLTVLPDAMQTVVPLSALGGTTGRIAFMINVYVMVAPLTPVLFDWLPDTTLPPARVQ